MNSQMTNISTFQRVVDQIKQLYSQYPDEPPEVVAGYFDLHDTDDSTITPQHWESFVKPRMLIKMRTWNTSELQGSSSRLGSSRRTSGVPSRNGDANIVHGPSSIITNPPFTERNISSHQVPVAAALGNYQPSKNQTIELTNFVGETFEFSFHLYQDREVSTYLLLSAV